MKMYIVLNNGDRIEIHEQIVPAIELVLDAIQKENGIGIVADDLRSYRLEYYDDQANEEKIRENIEAGKAEKHGRAWDPYERSELTEMFASARSIECMANVLKRTQTSILNQLVLMGLITGRESMYLQKRGKIENIDSYKEFRFGERAVLNLPEDIPEEADVTSP